MCNKLLMERWGRQCNGDVLEALVKVVDSVANPAAAEELVKAWFQKPKAAAYPWAEAAFWEVLTPERAIAARVFAEVCVETKVFFPSSLVRAA